VVPGRDNRHLVAAFMILAFYTGGGLDGHWSISNQALLQTVSGGRSSQEINVMFDHFSCRGTFPAHFPGFLIFIVHEPAWIVITGIPQRGFREIIPRCLNAVPFWYLILVLDIRCRHVCRGQAEGTEGPSSSPDLSKISAADHPWRLWGQGFFSLRYRDGHA